MKDTDALDILASVVGACPMAIAVNDGAGNVTHINGEFTRLFGYTNADFRTLEQWWPLAYPDAEYRRTVADGWSQRLLAAQRTGQPFEPMEVRVRCRSGAMRTVLASASPMGGIFQGLHIVSLYDLSERLDMQASLEASRRLLESVIETLPVRVFWKDRTSRYLGCNLAFARDAGVGEVAQVVGRFDDDLGWREQAALYRADDLRVMASGQPKLAYEEPQTTPSGEKIWLRTSKVPLRDEAGETTGVLGIYEDITVLKEAADRLHLAALVFNHSSEGMLVTDGNDCIVLCNPAFTRMTGYSLDEIRGKNPRIFKSGRQDQSFYRQMWQSLEQTGHWQGELWNRRKDGQAFAESVVINTIYADDGSVSRRVALFSDITDKKRSDELIWTQANFDSLTGLPNRRMARDRLEQDIKKTQRGGRSLALFFIDLDRFKDVNDTLGHDKGDELLIEAARRIRACVRESDTVARMGGDEFTVILPALEDGARVERVAMDINEALERPFQIGQNQAYVSASIGITLYPDDGTDLDDLLRNADQAMYVAKSSGRNRFSYFTSAMQDAALKRLHMLNDMREALRTGQFELHYQPIVDLSTGVVRKAEALLRWKHPLIGYVSPADFIPLAEESGLIHPLGVWVFQQAAWQVKRWQERLGESFQISVNMSAVQFRGASADFDWIRHLASVGVSGRSVVVEITESALLDKTEGVMSRLLEFRDADVQVAIDDFGTGYSSLAYLKKFDIDYLKIDKSFIHNLGVDPNDLVLTETMVVMAHKMGIQVIAEGVESQAQLEQLKAIGCDYAQGYHLGRPMAAAEFERLVPLAAQVQG